MRGRRSRQRPLAVKWVAMASSVRGAEVVARIRATARIWSVMFLGQGRQVVDVGVVGVGVSCSSVSMMISAYGCPAGFW